MGDELLLSISTQLVFSLKIILKAKPNVDD